MWQEEADKEETITRSTWPEGDPARGTIRAVGRTEGSRRRPRSAPRVEETLINDGVGRVGRGVVTMMGEAPWEMTVAIRTELKILQDQESVEKQEKIDGTELMGAAGREQKKKVDETLKRIGETRKERQGRS